MITRVQIKNYKSLADVDVTLEPLTVLVGKNGSGKSTFLDALHFVKTKLQQGPEFRLTLGGWANRLTHDLSDDLPIEFSITLKKGNNLYEYGFSFVLAEEEKDARLQEYCRVDGVPLFHIENGQWIDGNDLLSRIPLRKGILFLLFAAPFSEEAEWVLQYLSSTLIYDIVPANFRHTVTTAESSILDPFGSNLAYLLEIMKQEKSISRITSALKSSLNDITDIDVKKVGEAYRLIQLKHQENGEEKWRELRQESDGTIRLLALLVAIYQPVNGLIAIEEPENSLHPGVLEPLSESIKEAAVSRQILAATQSPDFISCFAVEQLRIVEKVNGATYIGSIDPRQSEIIHRQLFTTGDLLRIEGLRHAPSIYAGAENA